MRRFKYKWQAELCLLWINFYIPFKIKKEGGILLSNNSKVLWMNHFGFNNKNPWLVWKAFITQGMIDDLTSYKGLDISVEIEKILAEEIKKAIENEKTRNKNI